MRVNMTIESLNQRVQAERGKAGGWPSELTYSAAETADCVEVCVDAVSTKDGVWKKVDPWGLAFLHEVKKATTAGKPLRLKFSVGSPSPPRGPSRYEALKRRVSYLAAANAADQLQISLFKEGGIDALYTIEQLAHRPDTETIRCSFKARSDDDTPGRLEKDFQAYLFGKGKYINSDSDASRTNERLALFGPDFLRIGKLASAKKQKRYKVEREFPTGAFSGEIREANRTLPTEFVDLVTLNRRGELAVIEIKFDDPSLEVVPQVLNYALFFYSYRSKLAPLLDKKLECATKDRFVTYLVSNTFHEKFESVWPYYSNRQGPLILKRVIMGHMPEMPDPSVACDRV
jgi:hypothetical protein